MSHEHWRLEVGDGGGWLIVKTASSSGYLTKAIADARNQGYVLTSDPELFIDETYGAAMRYRIVPA